ncbi:hypothetical protein EXN66_Car017847 [Channa argus]|uniref:Uncharacterized protein n=1 Tax=Channa argus TaxID=215402 RepID=A0A6G1QIE5_CHAAH|nr:hypothetical protein EXN66_Car017847 [Channa argus]
MQVNFSNLPLIGGLSKAWVAEAPVQMRPPSESAWLRLRQEDAPRGKSGDAIVLPGPGAPREFQIETKSLGSLIP